MPLGALDPAASPQPAPRPAPAPAPAPTPAPVAPRAPDAGGEDSSPPPATGGIRSAVRGGIEQKKDAFKEAANPPTGGNYGKSQAALLIMLKESRTSVVTELSHLPDTSSDVASKIDADILKVSDPMGGGDAIRAMDRLSKIGRPAIPRVLSIAAKLDFGKYSKVVDARDACVLGDAVDSLMRDITGFDKFTRLQFSPNVKLEDYSRTIESWYLWWYTTGYRRASFDKDDAGADDKL